MTKILLSITKKMQHHTIFFVTVNAVHVSGGFSAHHQELAVALSKLDIHQMLCVQF
jgi:3,4-dihydroxy-2-butanone 4-phosphate synthase